MPSIRAIMTLLVLLALLIASLARTASTNHPPTLAIAAASSFRETLPKLIDEFTLAHPNIRIRVTYSASGTLAANIERGAPYDAFLSADFARPKRLEALDMLTTKGVSTLAQSHAVLVQNTRTALASESRTAIPNPRFAPFGKAAESWVNSTPHPEPFSFVYASSVSHAAALLKSGAVTGAFLDPSHARRFENQSQFKLSPLREAPPITLTACVIATSKNIATAEQFVAYAKNNWTQQSIAFSAASSAP